ncbi:hypothetical protein [Listeria booriae]|uniref:hypothetical protein n=1 Tax=Listeria booriae TaxID=1552123 RepID=UPI00164E2E8B|nr:hypothetical protein [Listeria booriae]MBC6300314.1 hypothetical protein [Listeria booriae]
MLHVPVKVDVKAVTDILDAGLGEGIRMDGDDMTGKVNVKDEGTVDADIRLLSVKQLRDIAKEKELDVPGNASKDVLVAAILANAETDNVNDDDTGDDAQ